MLLWKKFWQNAFFLFARHGNSISRNWVKGGGVIFEIKVTGIIFRHILKWAVGLWPLPSIVARLKPLRKRSTCSNHSLLSFAVHNASSQLIVASRHSPRGRYRFSLNLKQSTKLDSTQLSIRKILFLSLLAFMVICLIIVSESFSACDGMSSF